jgi:hypothetical protein
LEILPSFSREGLDFFDFSKSRTSWAMKLGRPLVGSIAQLLAKFGCLTPINIRVIDFGRRFCDFVSDRNYYASERGSWVPTSLDLSIFGLDLFLNPHGG